MSFIRRKIFHIFLPKIMWKDNPFYHKIEALISCAIIILNMQGWSLNILNSVFCCNIVKSGSWNSNFWSSGGNFASFSDTFLWGCWNWEESCRWRLQWRATWFGFSRPQFVRGFFFRNFTFDFETILSLQPSPSLFTNAQCYAFVRIFTARQMLLSFEAKQFVSDKSLKPS